MKRCQYNRGAHQFFNDGSWWRCARCSWFVHDSQMHVLFNREAVCWECGQIFKIREETLNEAKPICEECENPAPSIRRVK
jgi:hypothetical protein